MEENKYITNIVYSPPHPFNTKFPMTVHLKFDLDIDMFKKLRKTKEEFTGDTWVVYRIYFESIQCDQFAYIPIFQPKNGFNNTFYIAVDDCDEFLKLLKGINNTIFNNELCNL